MKHITCMIVMTSVACGMSSADTLYSEAFDYPTADLTGGNGGTGWGGAWTDSGNPAVVRGSGLTYSDPSGRTLNVSGQSTDTADGGSATTISFRDFDAPLNDVWISFLYQLPASNSKFEGVTFYRGTQKVFSVSNPSITTGGAIFLTNDLIASNGVNTGSGVFGQTYFIVLKLTKSGGIDGKDRIGAFIDPILKEAPFSPSATVDGTNFDIERIRIAGQNGGSLLVDEIRVGNNWEDVSPHTTPADIDSDGDGLTDAREISLGLDPEVSNAALIAALRANANWFSLHVPAEITDMSIGGLNIHQDTPGNLGYTFSLRDRFGNPTEIIDRPLTPTPPARFFRLTIETP